MIWLSLLHRLLMSDRAGDISSKRARKHGPGALACVAYGRSVISYAKLRNLQVGYSLPKQLISKYGISRLRVYCSIDNLFMISGFDGVDPEAISGNYYPLTRNYSFGLNVTF